MARDITKLVLKATVVTLLSVVGAAIVVFLLLSFTAPAAMARLTRDVGLYKQSAWYSSLQYANGKGDIEHIEFAMNCCDLAGDEEGVIRYGTVYLTDSRFGEYSAAREAAEADGGYLETYTQYVYGRIGAAYYHTGQKEEAIRLTLSVNSESFTEYNAVNDLVDEVLVGQDKSFAAEILSRLSALRENGTIENTEYLDKTIRILQDFTLLGV